VTRLSATFTTPAALVAAHDQEMTRGGLLVRGEVPAGVALFADVELAIEGGGKRVLTPAQVVQMLPGVGVAVTFAAARVAGLAEWIEMARALGASGWSDAAPAARAAAASAAVSPAQRLREASVPEKINIALHGSRDERGLILRDTNRLLHPYVLKNPNLQMDEVVAMARMAAISPELLKQIADRREWIARPDIAIALVRNPTVPVLTALKALEHVSPADLRQLAKDTRTRPAIQQAARRKVVG
jgi:hypothetical protein